MPKLHMLHSVTNTINTSFILQSDTSTIVFDGGFPCEEEYLYEYLKNLGGHVDTWFLTHIHDDHVSAMTKIMENHPDMRVSPVDDKTIRIAKNIDIGCAVDVPGGLIVPVIRNANMKDLRTISIELLELTEKAEGAH